VGMVNPLRPVARYTTPCAGLQVFPTAVRTTGVGVVTACARCSGALAPGLVAAVARRPADGMMVCTALALACAALAATFPVETSGAALSDECSGATAAPTTG
jgi:hypothetical protein